MQHAVKTGRLGAGAAEVAHDLRQYLAAGLLLTEQVGPETAADAIADSPRDRLATIHDLLLSMRDLVAAELDGNDQREELVDLTGLARECVRVTETTHGCSVAVTHSPGAVARVDRVAIRRALMNVLDNAGRAAGPHGLVSVEVAVAATGIVVTVRDDGAGFGRIESRSGHGLAIVDAALCRCGGHAEVTSTPGAGTAVRLTIPLRHERQAG